MKGNGRRNRGGKEMRSSEDGIEKGNEEKRKTE
jgi:hypothetical protein